MEDQTVNQIYSMEAEKSVLGSMLISKDATDSACELLLPEDFYVDAHRDIFEVMYRLDTENKGVDVVTVTDALDKAGKLDKVGSVVYLTELSLFTPSASNVGVYIGIVRERSTMRKLAAAGSDITRDARGGDKTVDEMLNDAERSIFDISMNKTQDSLVPISGAVTESFERISELIKLKGRTSGVATGYTKLDRLTGGLQKGDLIIIAGRPSMGKTALALNIAQYAATKDGRIASIFSLEMPSVQIAMRMICAGARVDMQRIKSGEVTDDELLRVMETLPDVSGSGIMIDDTGGIGVNAIRTKCRRQKAKDGLDLVIIDYLQLMQTRGKSDNRVTEIAEITRSLKILARELNVPIILLSQLSRDPEKREDKHPMMSDLRESGAIEQDADLIMLLYRASFYDKTDDNVAEVIVAKNRNGPTDTIKLAWIENLAMFENLAEGREDAP